MNILFIYSAAIHPFSGGVERVTFLLANYLESKGYKVFFLGLTDDNSIKDKRQFLLPDPSSFLSQKNITFFRSFLIEKSIKIVINKGGTDPETSSFAYNCKIEGVKLISNVHNSLLGTVKNFSSVHKIKFDKTGIGWLLPLTQTKIVKNLLLKLYKKKYAKHYKSLCEKSDYVILESDKFKEELMFFMDGQSIDNVNGISNFVLLEETTRIEKKKEILFVGRINTSQKRVDLLLEIWSLLYDKFPDWSLNVVGGGEELESIKRLSGQLGLQNIFFYGFQNAKPYYESASVICLTSSYEGFGVTLIEAMHYGAVPIAFDSYLSVTDIIDDAVNGCLITPFNTKEYANALSKLMSSKKELESYSAKAVQKAKNFDLSIIGQQWLELIKKTNIN